MIAIRPPRRWTTALAAITLAVLPMSALAAEPAQKKNVLFISTDDLNTRLGCYGDPLVKTPNLDRLASRGVRFDRAYCQYPLCNPSRVSLLTGLRPDTLRVHDLETNFRSTTPNAVTLPQLFRNNGYFAARVGKIFHYGVPREIGTDGKDDPQSWDFKFNPIGRDKTEESQLHILHRGGYAKTIGFAMAWREMDGPDEDQTDARGVTETIRLLEANKDKPFFIGMGFFRPHTPFVAPKKYFDLYPLNRVTLPERTPEETAGIPDIARNIRPDNYGLSDKDLKDCLRGYLASISFVDAQVGRLLDALNRLGLADKTIVVFWSDNGFLLGEHGQWQKQMLFEPSPKVPLIIYDPSAKGNGKPCARPVELLDLYPTLAELTGLTPPANLEGRSLIPFLADPSAPSDRPAFSQVTRRTKDKRLVMGYSVHTDRYRYAEWDDGKEGLELYDHQSDPDEMRNLAQDPAHAQTLATLKSHLTRLKRPAGSR